MMIYSTDRKIEMVTGHLRHFPAATAGVQNLAFVLGFLSRKTEDSNDPSEESLRTQNI